MSISISCIETIRHNEAVYAIESTLKCVNVSKIYWFSNIDFPKDINCEVINVKIKHFNLKENFNEAYSYLTLKLIPEIIETDFNLIVQYDGYAINKAAWSDTFLNYDYIGSVVSSWFPNKRNVGNGGFSLRSKKLYDAMKSINIKYISNDLVKTQNKNAYLYYDILGHQTFPEDFIICSIYRKLLEKEYGIKFAPENIANKFSIGSNLKIESNNLSYRLNKSFGFHGHKMLNFYNSVFYNIIKESKK